MPSAALIEVLEWPTPKVSYSLSARLGNGRKSAVLLDGVQLIAPPGEHLVRVGLVADVPDEPIVGRVEDVVQGDGELDRAKAGGEVPATGTDAVDEEIAQLARQRRQFRDGQAAQIRRRCNRGEQRILVERNGHRRAVYTRMRAMQKSTGAAQLARLTTKSASCARCAARSPKGLSAAIAAVRSSCARWRAAARPAVLG